MTKKTISICIYLYIFFVCDCLCWLQVPHKFFKEGHFYQWALCWSFGSRFLLCCIFTSAFAMWFFFASFCFPSLKLQSTTFTIEDKANWNWNDFFLHHSFFQFSSHEIFFFRFALHRRVLFIFCCLPAKKIVIPMK